MPDLPPHDLPPGATLGDPPPESDGETIARLAALPPLEYERAREAEAKRMGIRRPATLDHLVAAARPKAAPEPAAAGQGRTLTLPTPEPWPEAVDGAALLAGLESFFRRHLVAPAGAHAAMSAWVLHTYTAEQSRHSPRLAFLSPEKGCGKTTALDLLGLVVCRPLPTANITSAALFRTIELARPTALIDEADSFLKDNEDLRGILNAGHARGGQVIRCIGDAAEPRAFAVFGPCAIAGIGGLPGTIADRSITVPMQRAAPGERPEPIRRAAEAEGAELARRCARWAQDHGATLAEAEPIMPSAAVNRQADNWRPLLAIAEAAAGAWPERLAKALLGLRGDDGRDGRRVELLRDLRSIFTERDADRLSSADLIAALAGMEDRPWPEYHAGRPITAPQLARVLKGFSIVPIKQRDGGEPVRGYRRAAFADAWSRYLPEPEHAEQGGPPPSAPERRNKPQNSATFGPPQPGTRPGTSRHDVPGKSGEKCRKSATCSGVPVWEGDAPPPERVPDETDPWEVEL